MAQFLWCQLPDNLQGYRVKLQHTAVIAQSVLNTDRSRWIGNPVAAPAAVVKYHQIAFTRQPFRNHMEMMLADDPAQLFQFRCGIEVRSDAPYDLSCLFIKDSQNIGLPTVKNNIFRFKPHITLVIPFVRAKVAHAVYMKIVAYTAV